MVIDFDGSTRMANAAIYRMFGPKPEESIGLSFTEIFINSEGFNVFTDIVLNAVAERRDSAPTIRVPVDGHLRSLSVTVNCLAIDEVAGLDSQVVIDSVADVIEIIELRETELRQAEIVGSQMDKIQQAYREHEDRSLDSILLL